MSKNVILTDELYIENIDIDHFGRNVFITIDTNLSTVTIHLKCVSPALAYAMAESIRDRIYSRDWKLLEKPLKNLLKNIIHGV